MNLSLKGMTLGIRRPRHAKVKGCLSFVFLQIYCSSSCWKSSVFGIAGSLHATDKTCLILSLASSRLEAIALRLEAIASRLEAIALRLDCHILPPVISCSIPHQALPRKANGEFFERPVLCAPELICTGETIHVLPSTCVSLSLKRPFCQFSPGRIS